MFIYYNKIEIDIHLNIQFVNFSKQGMIKSHSKCMLAEAANIHLLFIYKKV